MAQIGEPLPEPYYTFSQHAGIYCAYKRRCRQCKFIWATVEIPIWKKWDTRLNVRKCTTNIYHASKVTDTDLVEDLERDGAWISPGRVNAVKLGAVYRRRICSRACGAKPWVTLEVMASGVCVEDVTKCPVCKQFGAIFLRDGKPYTRLSKGNKC